jgi:mycothiol synthase
MPADVELIWLLFYRHVLIVNKRRKGIDCMPYSLSAGFSVRRPTLDDVGELFEMLIACDKAEYGRPRTTESELRGFWEMPGHDPAQDAWVIIASDGRMVAMAIVGHISPVSRLFSIARVHPDYASQGFSDYLLGISLERARELIPEAAADVRVSMGAWVSQKNVEFRQALERGNFTHVRSNWLMEINMDTPPPEPVWPENLELRPYTPDLLRAVFEADDEAFQDHWGHTPGNFEIWQLWMAKGEGFDPSVWFLAFDREEIAGYALCTCQNSEAWVGQLGVRRLWRRRGLGLALLHHAFGEFYLRGERRVALNVDSQNLTGATRLYTRAGMHPFEQSDVYELELRPGVELSTQELNASRVETREER